MLANAKVCLYPRNVEEAVRVLAEAGKRALALAGGTSASLSKDPEVDTLVDLTRMGFDAIEKTGPEWSIGANVRIQQVAAHQGLQDLWNGMLCQAARSVGARPIRNAATVGGNAVQLFRWSDPPVALLAMDASFDLVGPGGRRTLAADEFFARHPKQVLGPAELLTRVRLREQPGVHGGAFTKFSRTAFDLAVVDAAVCLGLEGGRCKAARVVVGATRNVPWRAREAEALLIGQKPSAATVQRAAEAARQATQTAADIRTGKDYRIRMVEVIVRRTIERALDLAR